jgi:putative ABC transport system ATP-binding protein
MNEETKPLLRAVSVKKSYPDGNVTALVDVTLTIDEHEYVVIMGPSGSGKSTLLNLLGGLDRPSEGEVFFKDLPLSQTKNLDKLRAQKIGFVFQSFYLLPTLTALENVQVPMFETSLHAKDRLRKAQELLAAVGMSHRSHHVPTQLSVGERQRVAIARALANDPELLLADEPTGNLDSRTAEEVLKLLESLHRERGMALVVVTHDQKIASRAKRIIRLSDGRVIPFA